MKRVYDVKHRIWASAIRYRFGDKCVVCGATNYLSAHHLIPWEVEKFRFDYNNGIPLCPLHHTRYGHGLSPHSDGSILFAMFLQEKFPKILKWVLEKFDDI